eukprot:5702249-Alexandrium_andersonii.AAC.1
MVSHCPLRRLRRALPARQARPPSRSQLPSTCPRLRPEPTLSRRPRSPRWPPSKDRTRIAVSR